LESNLKGERRGAVAVASEASAAARRVAAAGIARRVAPQESPTASPPQQSPVAVAALICLLNQIKNLLWKQYEL
jgi:hypothetical protein